eukprot:TRINITY_DN4309_c0_g1_i1.p1 TRINITY_DN4309_c0_g1~~TRINITY_DN4309_c0_g1_i1.p1  ORF type:complete len:171 (-),score=32.20 TRINITY_DN4309_c0_g1_i1:9-521(-)
MERVLILSILVTWIRFCKSQNECNMLENTDFFGNDIEPQPALGPSECCAACWKHPKCAAFTYVERSNTCWLKELKGNQKTVIGVTSGTKKESPPVPVPPPPENSSLSLGSIILIVFFSVLLVYIVVGFIYNKQVNEYSGMDNIPNMQFWRSVPGYIQAGITFCIQKLKSQ